MSRGSRGVIDGSRDGSHDVSDGFRGGSRDSRDGCSNLSGDCDCGVSGSLDGFNGDYDRVWTETQLVKHLR